MSDRPSAPLAGLDLPTLLGLSAFALAARLPGLTRSLTYDELFTLATFSRSPFDAISEQVAAADHPLASLLVWAAQLVFDGEVGLRLPFVILGALAAPALAWSLAQAAGRRAGLVAGALLALAPWPVLASQQLRGYAPMLLAASLLPGLVLGLCGCGGLRPPPPPCASSKTQRRTSSFAETGPWPWGRVILTAVVVALGGWAHATLFAVALGMIPAVLLAPRLGGTRQGRKAALAGLGGGLALGLLLWAPILGRTWKYVRRSFQGELSTITPGPLDPAGALELLGGGSFALGLALLALSTVPSLVRRGRAVEALVLLGPVAAALALLAARPLGFPRFLGFALPALLGLAACGLSRLVYRRGVLAAALAGLLLVAAARTSQNAASELHDLRGAMRVAVERGAAHGGAPILALGPGAELCPAYGPAEPDPRGERLGDLLDGPLVVVVPLPAWLPHAPELRGLLYGDEWSDPVVLPGRESAALVFATRSR